MAASNGPNSTEITALLQGQTHRRHGFIFSPSNGEEYWDDQKGESRWRCRHCPTNKSPTFSLKSTRNALDHLEQKHFINRKTGEALPLSRRDPGQQTLQFTSKSKKQEVRFHHRIYKAKLVDWIANDNIGFRVVGSRRFLSLLQYLVHTKPTIQDLIRAHPRSQTTIRRWIMQHYQRSKERIKEELASALSSIHLSFDLWTSPNRHALLGIVAYWISKEGTRKGLLLGLRPLLGPHTGIAQAGIVWDIAEEYGITERLGYTTLDNAKNNDTALREIEGLVKELGHDFDAVKRRVRCFGHVINLSVTSFLWGSDAASFARQEDAEENGNVNLADEIASMKAWRQRGPLGRLHNIIIHINRSPQRLLKFQEKVRTHQPDAAVVRLTVGCPTRWSSDYDSLELARKYRVSIDAYVDSEISTHRRVQTQGNQRRGRGRRAQVQAIQDAPAFDFLEEDELKAEDWEILDAIHSILRPMRVFTKRLQGKTNLALVSEVLPAMDMILACYEKVCFCIHYCFYL